MQSILHVLFLPSPFKRALAAAQAAIDPSVSSATKSEPGGTLKGGKDWTEDLFTEVVKPGALYRECAVVKLQLPPLPAPDSDPAKETEPSSAARQTQKKKGKKGEKKVEEDLIIEDDGEYGGESMGRVVWEWYEQRLKAWEAAEPPRPKETPAEKTSA